MKQDQDFFDKHYFDTFEDIHRGNYTRVGGYASYAENLPWDTYADHVQELCGGNMDDCFTLDIGCVYGFFVAILRSRGAIAYGMDISEYAIGKADPQIQPFLRKGDVSLGVQSPFLFDGASVERKWDCVTSFDVLEHVNSEQEAYSIMSNIGSGSLAQWHKVNTGEPGMAFEGDLSHGLRKHLSWWQEIAIKVERETGCVTEITE